MTTTVGIWPEQSPRPLTVVDLSCFSMYVLDHAAAVAIYTRVFGAPERVDAKLGFHGWKTGAPWLTAFADNAGTSPGSNPRNAEIAVAWRPLRKWMRCMRLCSRPAQGN